MKKTSLFCKVCVLWNRNLLGPVALASALAVGILAARFFASGSHRYHFLLWNLFLAWVPYLCGIGLAEMRQRGVHWPRGVAALAVACVLFLPNAPYLVTDFVHLLDAGDYAFWYDVGLIAAFAWAGLLLTIASLRICRELVAQRFGEWAARGVVAGAAVVSGAGIYVGRVLRWNSWDVLLHPKRIVRLVGDVIGDPFAHRRGAVVSMVFAGLVWVCYATFTVAGSGRPDNARRIS